MAPAHCASDHLGRLCVDRNRHLVEIFERGRSCDGRFPAWIWGSGLMAQAHCDLCRIWAYIGIGGPELVEPADSIALPGLDGHEPMEADSGDFRLEGMRGNLWGCHRRSDRLCFDILIPPPNSHTPSAGLKNPRLFCF